MNSSFTTLLASETVRQVSLEWGAEMMQDFQNPAAWRKTLEEWDVRAEQVRLVVDGGVFGAWSHGRLGASSTKLAATVLYNAVTG
jgi:hypothetical protein